MHLLIFANAHQSAFCINLVPYQHNYQTCHQKQTWNMTAPNPARHFPFSIPFLSSPFSQKFRQGWGAPADKQIIASMAFAEDEFPLIHFRGRSSHSARLRISISSLLIITRYLELNEAEQPPCTRLSGLNVRCFHSLVLVSMHRQTQTPTHTHWWLWDLEL